MAKKQKIDLVLLGIVSLLVVWGILTVSTISFPFSLQVSGSPWNHLLHQLFVLGIGLSAGLFFFLLPLEKLKKLAPWLFFLNLVMLLAVFLPKIGLSAGGARRWLKIGGLTLQPSEFLKITFLLYLSSWLANRQESKKRQTLKIFLPFCLMLFLLFLALILQPDMSTLFLISTTAVVIYFCAIKSLWHIALMIGLGAGGGWFLIKKAPYRLSRLLIFLHPETDPLGQGYQLRQAMIALGSGRLSGINNGFALGMSRQKFGFLPQPMTDSIFAIIGEELGFLGAVGLIVVFLLLAFWGFKIAREQTASFYKLTALGITFWLTLQAFFNIGGICGLLPLGGVPLPFFSYGGSHLITELAAVGILLNISKNKLT